MLNSVNTLVELTIDSVAYGGRPVGRLDGMVVFVDGAVPGDRVRARIVRRKKDYLEAVTEEVLAPSADRVEPRCPRYGVCGGCAMQTVSYEEQLRQKARQVRESLVRIGKQPDLPIEPIRPSPVIWRYRNKMDYTFGADREGRVIIGMHQKGEYAGIVDVEECWLQPESFDRALGVVRRFARESGMAAYDARTHRGFWRHLILRHSVAEDTMLAVLITATGELPQPERLIEQLQAAGTNLKGFVWAVNNAVADVASCQERRWQWGDKAFRERLGQLWYRVSPLSFFQVNTQATEALYQCVADSIEPNRALNLLDAYCGTGSIGIFCAEGFAQVVGVESTREAVWDARENAALNGLTNCTFLCGDVKKMIALARQSVAGRFARIVVDPPRGGMDKKALQALLMLRAPIIVYVSCNPATLARDVVTLSEWGYLIERVQPFDLFPHTPHVEAVIKFRLHEDKAKFPVQGRRGS
jgi:23S rRNA (uracil1939-C5)-methyltransferase